MQVRVPLDRLRSGRLQAVARAAFDRGASVDCYLVDNIWADDGVAEQVVVTDMTPKSA